MKYGENFISEETDLHNAVIAVTANLFLAYDKVADDQDYEMVIKITKTAAGMSGCWRLTTSEPGKE